MAKKGEMVDKMFGEHLSEEIVFEMNANWLQGANTDGTILPKNILDGSTSKTDGDYGIRTWLGKYGWENLNWN